MIAVVADDFSGSAELGGIALRYGLKAEISTDPERIGHPEMIIIDSNTRSATLREAKRKITEISGLIKELPPDLLYKKVDSVLRGHLLPELLIMMQLFNKQLALLVPANPSARRIIKNGTYYLNGSPLHQTEFAQDPEFPARSSDVIDLIGANVPNGICTRASCEALPEKGIVVAETVDQDDLSRWQNMICTIFYRRAARIFLMPCLRRKSGPPKQMRKNFRHFRFATS